MKSSIFILLAAFVQVRAIFEINASPDTRKCYKCSEIENCKIPWLQECSIEDHCFSKTVTIDNVTVETKGCIGVDAIDTLCEENQEGLVECYTCSSNFCNVKESEFDRGVKQCYHCVDECDNPPAVQNCEEVLSVREKKIVKAACLRYQIKKDDEITINKGCMLDVSSVKSACTMSTLTYSEISCSYCTKELCNYERDEVPVDECYHCVDDCTNPTIQNCREELGAAAISRCVAAEYEKEDGTQVAIRGCIKENDDFVSTCNSINENGGNCTVCAKNLCNDIYGVKECYSCEGECTHLEVEDCKAKFGDHAKTRCLTSEITQNNNIVESRKCIEISDEEEAKCEQINQDGGSCSICDSERCNLKTKDPNYVDHCYSCDNSECNILKVEECQESVGEYAKSRCRIIANTEGNEAKIERGCVHLNEEVSTVCEETNQSGGNCTLCDTNLCNDFIRVNQCYHCDGNCNSFHVQNCVEFGENAETRCISTAVDGNELRKCILLSSEEVENCDKINADGGSCNICDSELCNIKEKDPNSVDECYLCENGKCESPLQKQQCREIFGEYAATRCAILETFSDGETLVLTKCIDSNDNEFKTICDAAIASGRNCTICSTNLCNDILGQKEEEEEKDDGNSSPERLTLVLYTLIVSIIFAKIL